MFVQTGVAAGPLKLRGLNQNAVNHTLAPGETVPGKTMLTTVRVVCPSNFQPASVVGASSPTKLKTLAPATPSGLPRRVGLAGSCRRIFTVFPLTETISMSGEPAGAGIGEGSVSRTVNPKSCRC